MYSSLMKIPIFTDMHKNGWKCLPAKVPKKKLGKNKTIYKLQKYEGHSLHQVKVLESVLAAVTEGFILGWSTDSVQAIPFRLLTLNLSQEFASAKIYVKDWKNL